MHGLNWYVHAPRLPGEPFGPFTEAEAMSFRAYLYRFFDGVFSVRKGE